MAADVDCQDAYETALDAAQKAGKALKVKLTKSPLLKALAPDKVQVPDDVEDEFKAIIRTEFRQKMRDLKQAVEELQATAKPPVEASAKSLTDSLAEAQAAADAARAAADEAEAALQKLTKLSKKTPTSGGA